MRASHLFVAILVAAMFVPAPPQPVSYVVSPDVTCTGATLAQINPGLNAAVQDFEVEVQPSVFLCKDNRDHEDPGKRVIGAEIKGKGLSAAASTCSKFAATLDVEVDWIVTDSSREQSVASVQLDVDLTSEPMKLEVRPKITKGLFEGYTLAGEQPDVELEVLVRACNSEAGLTRLVGLLTTTFTRPADASPGR